jgi:hypothetical protein
LHGALPDRGSQVTTTRISLFVCDAMAFACSSLSQPISCCGGDHAARRKARKIPARI